MAAVRVDALDLDGQGVARLAGKVVFIDGALPGETVEFDTWRQKPRYDLANLTRVVRASAMRVVPRCRHYERCGGCSLQHLDARAQVAIKQRVLEDALARIGRVRPNVVLPAIHGSAWNYRQRARLSVKHVAKKGGVLVGFREKRTHWVADMDSCEVLPERASTLIPSLRGLLSELTIAARIPQLELAAGDDVLALCLRVLDMPSAGDIDRLRGFARAHDVEVAVQPGGPDSVRSLDGFHGSVLAYRLPEFGLRLSFATGEFTQVNAATNRVLVRRAVALLDPQPGDSIADLFCGLGNFTLALAARGAQVFGFEGSQGLVHRAQLNARENDLAERAQFVCTDLLREPTSALRSLERLPDKMLLDPPRNGAAAVLEHLGDWRPRRIVYVSCDPATLARDAATLVHEKGYTLDAAGVVNMFPHTSHVESIALFERID